MVSQAAEGRQRSSSNRGLRQAAERAKKETTRTIEAAQAYKAELAKRYRLFDELSADEQQRALSEFVPAKRRTRRALSRDGAG